MKIGILHTAFIGDVILSGLLVEALFAAGHEIYYFTKKNTASIFSNDIRVKKVVEVNKGKGFKKLFSPKNIARQICSEQLNVLLVPHRSATSTLSAFFAKVPMTIGFDNANLSFLYKRKAKFLNNSHECLRYLEFLNPSLIETNLLEKYKKIARPVLQYNEQAFVNFNDKFKGTEIEQVQNNFFILAVGSVWKTKKYLVEHWVDVVFEFLRKYPNYYCVLTGSSQDKEDINFFLDLFVKKCASNQTTLISKVINAVNMFSLFEFALFTSKAKFVLSNDSSPIHFSAAFNVPVVAVFGPTIPEFGFAPSSTINRVVSYKNEKGERLSCQPCSIHGQNKCPQKHFKCMKELKPQTVVKAIESLLCEF